MKTKENIIRIIQDLMYFIHPETKEINGETALNIPIEDRNTIREAIAAEYNILVPCFESVNDIIEFIEKNGSGNHLPDGLDWTDPISLPAGHLPKKIVDLPFAIGCDLGVGEPTQFSVTRYEMKDGEVLSSKTMDVKDISFTDDSPDDENAKWTRLIGRGRSGANGGSAKLFSDDKRPISKGQTGDNAKQRKNLSDNFYLSQMPYFERFPEALPPELEMYDFSRVENSIRLMKANAIAVDMADSSKTAHLPPIRYGCFDDVDDKPFDSSRIALLMDVVGRRFKTPDIPMVIGGEAASVSPNEFKKLYKRLSKKRLSRHKKRIPRKLKKKLYGKKRIRRVVNLNKI